MKVTVLTDNMAGGHFLAEHGLSYLLQTNGNNILFDTGHTDVFLRNAQKLNIDINRMIDTIVLSHGHWDHGDGLQYLKNKKLICHPEAFIKRYRKNNRTNLGLVMNEDQLNKQFDVKTSQDPLQIHDNIYFLGEIPRVNKFESQKTTFIHENGVDDFVIDDSALAIIEDNELIIITGCSHSGICNITAHAVQVTGISRVKAVMGGFHLKEKDEQTSRTIDFFGNLNIRKVFPSHCTELPALAEFYHAFGNVQVKTGMIINI